MVYYQQDLTHELKFKFIKDDFLFYIKQFHVIYSLHI